MNVDPSSFLLKEQELMKLNEEINIKTKGLLNRSVPKPKKEGKIKPKVVPPKTETPPVAVKPKSPPAEVDRNASEAVAQPLLKTAIPPRLVKSNISSEGLIKFLKSKVTILQDEVEIRQKENLKKTDELQSTADKLNKVEQQRDQVCAKNNQLQSALKKAEDRLTELELKLKERDNDSMRLGKEGDVSKRDLKALQQTNANLERRLTRALEELEALKVNLGNAYDQEKEIRDKARSERNGLEKQIKELRKQRITLLTAYKQQLLLLDNLKRQNLCLEQAKMIEFSEKEFTKILNWEK